MPPGTLVIDASIALKWVIEEEGTPQALALGHRARLIAPDLLVAECANICLKKVQRDELTKDQALLAARLLQSAPIEILPTRALLATAAGLAIDLDHPAYDCLYLALALEYECLFVTADERFVRKVRQARSRPLRKKVIGLQETAEPWAEKR